MVKVDREFICIPNHFIFASISGTNDQTQTSGSGWRLQVYPPLLPKTANPTLATQLCREAVPGGRKADEHIPRPQSRSTGSTCGGEAGGGEGGGGCISPLSPWLLYRDGQGLPRHRHALPELDISHLAIPGQSLICERGQPTCCIPYRSFVSHPQFLILAEGNDGRSFSRDSSEILSCFLAVCFPHPTQPNPTHPIPSPARHAWLRAAAHHVGRGGHAASAHAGTGIPHAVRHHNPPGSTDCSSIQAHVRSSAKAINQKWRL